MSSHRTVEPGVPPSETWSTQLVMPVQPALGGEYNFYRYGRECFDSKCCRLNIMKLYLPVEMKTSVGHVTI